MTRDNECWIVVKRIDKNGNPYEKREARIRIEDMPRAMTVADKLSRRYSRGLEESVETPSPARMAYLMELENQMII